MAIITACGNQNESVTMHSTLNAVFCNKYKHAVSNILCHLVGTVSLLAIHKSEAYSFQSGSGGLLSLVLPKSSALHLCVTSGEVIGCKKRTG